MASIVVAGDTSGSVTISAPAVAGSSTATLQPQSGTVALTLSQIGMKNRIINGAMVISQRGTSFSSNGYTLDRWVSSSGTTGAWTVTQSSTAPTGYINSLLFTKTSGNAPASGDYNYLVQFVEGLNITDLAWGTANAQTVTLSFWVRSGATGTFGGSLRNGAGDYSYPFTYTVSSANTWEQKSVTIAGPTTGTWATTNAIGISVFFDLGSGTSTRATAGAWTAGNFIGASGTSTYPTSTSSGTLQFTGVQLEVGSTATSFDYRPYGTELALCQRYYGFVNTTVPSTAGTYIAYIPYKVTMRASPTVVGGAGFTTYTTDPNIVTCQQTTTTNNQLVTFSIEL